MIAISAAGLGLSKPDQAFAASGSIAQLTAPAKACPDQPASGGNKAMRKAGRAMLCMVNYARKKRKLKRFRNKSNLNWSATRKAKDIRRCTFSHFACKRKFDHWIRKSGYMKPGVRSTGENIAWGSGHMGNVRSIFVAWMNSTGHRQAILSSSFSEVGVGVVRGRVQGIEGARAWVLHFGEN